MSSQNQISALSLSWRDNLLRVKDVWKYLCVCLCGLLSKLIFSFSPSKRLHRMETNYIVIHQQTHILLLQLHGILFSMKRFDEAHWLYDAHWKYIESIHITFHIVWMNWRMNGGRLSLKYTALRLPDTINEQSFPSLIFINHFSHPITSSAMLDCCHVIKWMLSCICNSWIVDVEVKFQIRRKKINP